MKCENYLYMIDELVEDELDWQTASHVNSHIFICRECSHYYEALKQEREIYENYFEIKSSPGLWKNFQTKLEAAQAGDTLNSGGIFARIFGWKSNVLDQLRLTTAVACASLLLLFGIVFGLLNFVPGTKISENNSIAKTESGSSQNIGGISDETIKNSLKISPGKNDGVEIASLEIKQKNSGSKFSDKRIAFESRAEKSVIKQSTTTKPLAAARDKKVSAKPLEINEKRAGKSGIEAEGDFYSLPFTGIFENSKEDMQILRVELPRASLVALGVDVPVEYGAEKIKTDLLVSSNGVTRAVRLLR